MFKSLHNFFEKKIREPHGVTSSEVTEKALMTATAALLIETTIADSMVKKEEQEAVKKAVQTTFGLSPEEARELIELGAKEVEGASSFYQFTQLINRGFPYEMKKRIVALLWGVVFADKELEQHEENLVRRVADLLNVSHRDFIDTKIEARKAAADKD